MPLNGTRWPARTAFYYQLASRALPKPRFNRIDRRIPLFSLRRFHSSIAPDLL